MKSLVVALCLPLSVAAQGFGTQEVITSSASDARSVYATDLDGDGDADVLSGSHTDNKIAWYEYVGAGNGVNGGAFGPQQVITNSADRPSSVYATDLDGDGDADVLSASVLDDEIAWYENLGGGTFGAQQVITSSADGAWSVYAADLDGDGDEDVLSASYNDDKIAWYENLGGGSFGAQQVITTGALSARSVYATDLDGDGDADVLSASYYDCKIAWYENLQDGFAAPQIISSNTDGATSVYATDLDGDGDADVLSASYYDDRIAWYENLGGGAFGSQQVISSGADMARSVYATDLDQDGDADVLSASRNDNRIAWYENLHQYWRCQGGQASNGDVTLGLSHGQASAPYYLFHSMDALNATSPGSSGFFGLHITIADVWTQVGLAMNGNPLFGGTLDANGTFGMSLPGGAVAFLSGQTWYGMGVQVNPGPTGVYQATPVNSITFQ